MFSILYPVVQKIRYDGFIKTCTTILYILSKSKRKYKQLFLREFELIELGYIFDETYKKKKWGDDESLSGWGSRASTTLELREWMIDALPNYGIGKVVDAPCGDFNWMKHVISKLNIEYFGFDIVGDVIQENKKSYGNDKTHFQTKNICEEVLPSCDLIISKDFLQHLSYQNIDKFLANLSKTEYKYLLTTTYLMGDEFENRNIYSGRFWPIDLFKKPFNFNPDTVIEQIDINYKKGAKKVHLLLAKSDVPRSLEIS